MNGRKKKNRSTKVVSLDMPMAATNANATPTTPTPPSSF